MNTEGGWNHGEARKVKALADRLRAEGQVVVEVRPTDALTPAPRLMDITKDSLARWQLPAHKLEGVFGTKAEGALNE